MKYLVPLLAGLLFGVCIVAGVQWRMIRELRAVNLMQAQYFNHVVQGKEIDALEMATDLNSQIDMYKGALRTFGYDCAPDTSWTDVPVMKCSKVKAVAPDPPKKEEPKPKKVPQAASWNCGRGWQPLPCPATEPTI